MRVSLRGQILLWYIIAMPIVIFALAFTAQRTMVVGLRENLDASLKRQQELVGYAITPSLVEPQSDYSWVIKWLSWREFPSGPILVRVADAAGNVVASSADIPEAVVPSLDRGLSPAQLDKGRFESVGVSGAESLRVYTAPLRAPGTQEVVAIIQTGASLAPVSGAQERLLLYALVLGSVGSVLTVGVGAFILHRGFRPLDRILERVSKVETADLKAGLPKEPRPPELQRLADSLNSMWRRLDSAFKTNRAFVARVSHDLRTPLAALQGQIDVLLMQPSLDAGARDSLERMAREVRRLGRLTNNLLLRALLESKPQIVVRPVGLSDLLTEVMSEVWPLADGLELDLTAPRELTVPGDRDLLKQMVLNVVDNAFKFTPRGGRVRFSLSQVGAWAVVGVEDTGQGMSGKQLECIQHGLAGETGLERAKGSGTGLGLIIVRETLELHGGRLEVQSRSGFGTSVRMFLPLVAMTEEGLHTREGSLST